MNVKVNTVLEDGMLSEFKFRNPNDQQEVLGNITWDDENKSYPTANTYNDAQFTFTPNDDNHNAYKGNATVVVSDKDTPDLTVTTTDLNPVYDGTAKSVSFTTTSDAGVTVKYEKETSPGEYTDIGAAPVDAGTYRVTASVVETANYAAASEVVTLTITPKTIAASATVTEKEYDGKLDATVNAAITNLASRDQGKVTVTATGKFATKDAGTNKPVTVTLTALNGDTNGNYQLPGTELHTTGAITKKEVTLTLTSPLSKSYGAGFELKLDQFAVTGLADGETAADLDSQYVVLTCDGVKHTTDVGEYPITVVNHEGGNYKATISGEAKLTVAPANAKLLTNSVQATKGKKGGPTSSVIITGTFVNVNSDEMEVPGDLSWNFRDGVEGNNFLTTATTATASWTFTPNHKNYTTKPVEGSVTIELMDREPVTFGNFTNMHETPYTGSAQSFPAVTASQNSTITYSYKNHVDGSYEHGADSGGTSSGTDYSNWNSTPPTNAGMYDVYIEAEPSPEYLEDYTSNSIVVHLHITAATPKVDITTNVDEGLTLGEVKSTVTGVNGDPVDGTFVWGAGEGSVIDTTTDYNWYFTSSDGNYGEAEGKTRFTFNADKRTIKAEVYNLPGNDGNYAVVNVSESGLKVGEVLTFYKDEACTDPESEPVTITGATQTALVVMLDGDALDPKGGTIYAKVNKTTFNATAISYIAEPGGELPNPLTLTVGQTYTHASSQGATSLGFEIADTSVVEVNDEGKLVALKVGSTTITVTLTYPHPDKARHDGETFTVTTTITVNVTEVPVSSGSTSKTETVTNSDGSTTTTTTNRDGSKTETTKYTDGTVTEKVTEKDGSATETTTTPDGVVGQTVTDEKGTVTSVAVDVPSAAAKEGTVTAPVEVDAVKDSKAAPEIAVKIGDGGSAKVEIPVTRFGPGTVAVLVHEDGTEEIVRDCVIGENGVVLNVEGSATLKIVDNTHTFADVEPANHWAAGAVEFVAARQLFNGTDVNEFTPDGDMERGMLVTVLYRLTYEPEAGDAAFADVDSNAYYADAVAWAESNGVVNGYGDTFAPEDNVTREQLVTILYRYAQKTNGKTDKTGTLEGYADAAQVSDYARDAMAWAVNIGLVNGVDASRLAPSDSATRAEVATILMRFCEKVM